jgi:hypothetical protein
VLLLTIIYTINLLVVRPRSYRVIYYFDTPALGRRHQSFGRVNDKEPSEAFDFFDQLAENTKQWETSLPLHVESRNTISHSSGKFQLK